MAWYRCGSGSGVPSSLKTEMNTVLNKKWGTSTTYPPEDWPADVNLMGPLPERTVSGAVVAFADGADDVPLKSASFGIVASGGGGTPSTPVPIVGHSSVTVYHTDGQTPPVESEQVTIQLGQTVYGGTLAEDGTLTITHVLKEYTVSNMNNAENYPGWKNAGVKELGVSSGYVSGNTNIGGGYSININSNNDIVYLSTNDYGMTQSQWISNYPDLVIQIRVRLATPIVITGLDEISLSTYLGDNTIWADTGDASVTYRRDIDLALAQ